MRNTFKGVLQSVSATKAQVHHFLTETERKPLEGKEGHLDTGMHGMMRLAFTSNRKPGSLMCSVNSTDSQLPSTFNQYSYSQRGQKSGGNTTKIISEMSQAKARTRTRVSSARRFHSPKKQPNLHY